MGLKIDDAVLAFNNKKLEDRDGTEEFVKGKVTDISTTDVDGKDIVVYEVLGEDGKTYRGSYKETVIGDAYFYVEIDYLKEIRNLIDSNNKKLQDYVNEIREKNNRLYNTIRKIEQPTQFKLWYDSLKYKLSDDQDLAIFGFNLIHSVADHYTDACKKKNNYKPEDIIKWFNDDLIPLLCEQTKEVAVRIKMLHDSWTYQEFDPYSKMQIDLYEKAMTAMREHYQKENNIK